MKKIIVILASVITLPLTAVFHLCKNFTQTDSLFAGLSQLLSLIPGKSGTYIRIGFYRSTMVYCSSDSMICFGSLFSQTDTEIYGGVYIGPQSNIGSCIIEKNCLLGSAVHILSGKRQHNYSNTDIPLKDQGGTLEKVIIGENTWIGNGAIVMANVGKNCVIGAGSVVTKDIEDYSIVQGNPAKVIRKHNET